MRRFVVALAASAAVVAPLQAQTDPRLASAVRLAQEGMGDSARAVAGRVLAGTRPTDTLYPEVLYTIAVVASTTQDKRLYLQRVAVEYSPVGLGRRCAPAVGTARLRHRQPGRDRPADPVPAAGLSHQSPARRVAALWGARAAFDTRDRALACQWAAAGLGAVGDDVELRNQFEFQRDRCSATVAADTGTDGRARQLTARPPARPSARLVPSGSSRSRRSRPASRPTMRSPASSG